MRRYYNLLLYKMKSFLRKKFKKQIFISYARKDSELIQSFLNNGLNRDFEIFVDQSDIKPGSNWKQRILNKINESNGAILFITKNSLRNDSPIRETEIPIFIYRNNDPKDNFEFFPVFLDYVQEETIKKYNFLSKSTETYEDLFETYDIWNLEANRVSDAAHKMPSEMSEDELNEFWAELNLQMSHAIRGRKVRKIGSANRWTSNPKNYPKYFKNLLKRWSFYIFVLALIAGLFAYQNSINSDQTSEVFDIGPGTVRISALAKGDCFDLVDSEVDINWDTYVTYRACDLLHDGEVFYRENQLDFGDNQVGYSNLLNLFNQTCNEEFGQYQNSKLLASNFEIQYYWDTDTQSLGSKPFDMLCLTLNEERLAGSYVEDITGISIVLPNPGDKYDCEDFESDQDAQAWYELYFDEYGDVALLDINNNGIVCDEIISSSNEAVEETTTSVPSSTSTTTVLTTTTTTLFVPESNIYENKLIQYDEIAFNVSDALKDSPNKKAITSFFNIDKSVQSWNPGVNLRIETHWRNGVYIKWNGCEWMGCMYKLSINGVNIGSHLFEGTYYTPNTNFYIGGLSTDRSYQIKLEPIDAMYQAYAPTYVAFSGNNWTNDDSFNPGWPLVYEIEGYKIYADQSSWIPPKANKDPIISISDRGSDYVFNLIEWDIEFKKFSIGYTHCLVFADDQLIGIMGNGTPNYYPLDKSWLNGGTLVGKTITLIAYDSPVMPGATYSFKFNG